MRKVEAANIYVDTPFYEGQLEVLCMEQPIYDLIIGNINGVEDPIVENIKTLSDSDMVKQIGLSNSDQSSSKATADVEQGWQMRAIKQKKMGKVEPLIVVNQTVDIVNVAQGVQTRAQKEDEGRVQSPKAVYEIVDITDVAQGVQTKFQKEQDTVKVQHSNDGNQVEGITEVTQDVQTRFQEEKEKGKIKPL